MHAVGVKHLELPPDVTSTAAARSCISRVVYDDKCIGSVCRITTAGLCVGAYHVLVDSAAGKYLDGAMAFGKPLEFLAGFPYYGIIFCQGAAPQNGSTNVCCAPGKQLPRCRIA
jgi:hypothetical protein